jgi:hypothetical protein
MPGTFAMTGKDIHKKVIFLISRDFVEAQWRWKETGATAVPDQDRACPPSSGGTVAGKRHKFLRRWKGRTGKKAQMKNSRQGRRSVSGPSCLFNHKKGLLLQSLFRL